jgi:hypothetical protein
VDIQEHPKFQVGTEAPVAIDEESVVAVCRTITDITPIHTCPSVRSRTIL